MRKTASPEAPARGKCPRCKTETVRFDPSEERFEVATNIPHTALRCERVRAVALSACMASDDLSWCSTHNAKWTWNRNYCEKA